MQSSCSEGRSVDIVLIFVGSRRQYAACFRANCPSRQLNARSDNEDWTAAGQMAQKESQARNAWLSLSARSPSMVLTTGALRKLPCLSFQRREPSPNCTGGFRKPATCGRTRLFLSRSRRNPRQHSVRSVAMADGIDGLSSRRRDRLSDGRPFVPNARIGRGRDRWTGELEQRLMGQNYLGK